MNMYRKLVLVIKNLLVFCSVLFMAFSLQAQDKRIAIPKQLIETAQQSNDSNSSEPTSSEPISEKIVGGTTALRGEFPEFVQLFIEGAVIGLDPDFVYSTCGGSLISANKVLTAAHCTVGISHVNYYALPGFYSFNDNISFSDLIPLSFKVENPQYQLGAAFNNDVAILTLSQPVSGPTAKLISTENQLEGFNATIIGTGALSEGGASPSTLQKVTIPIVSNAVCQASYGASAITDSMLCAGLTVGTRDSCQGDSGGPLWVDIDGQKTQAGIVSWGRGCARPNFYGVYSRISALIDFIRLQAPNTQIIELKDSIILAPMLHELLLNDSVYVPPPPPDPRLHCRTPRPDRCPADGESNYLYYFSEYGDYIGGGKTNLIRSQDAQTFTLQANYDNGVLANVHTPGYSEWWRLNLAAANDALLQVGRYTKATRFPFQDTTANGMSFSGSGRGCNSLTGEFEIFEIEYNASDDVIKLAVNFRQNCGSVASLFGYLRFNSNLPMLPL